MSDEAKPVEQSPKPQTQAERLHDELVRRFGMNFHHNLKLEIRADTLYWLVSLVEAGIQKRKEEFRAENGGKLDASSAASIAFAERYKALEPRSSKKPKKPKPE